MMAIVTGETERLEIDVSTAGARLDVTISSALPGISRSQVRHLLTAPPSG